MQPKIIRSRSYTVDSVSSLEMNSVSEKVPVSLMHVLTSPSIFSMSPKISKIGSVHLNINQAARATQNFSPSLRLGEGGFRTVYKAQLQDGQVVAIKRVKKRDKANGLTYTQEQIGEVRDEWAAYVSNYM